MGVLLARSRAFGSNVASSGVRALVRAGVGVKDEGVLIKSATSQTRKQMKVNTATVIWLFEIICSF